MRIQKLGIPDRFFGQLLPVAPDMNQVVDKIDELVGAVNDGISLSNAVIGGPKFVRYRNSALYGLTPADLTLDSLDPDSILPGNEAVVLNPADSPTQQTAPPKRYVATLAAASDPGAVSVPATSGSQDRVYITWQEVDETSSEYTPLLVSELDKDKAAYANLGLRLLLIKLINALNTATSTTVLTPVNPPPSLAPTVTGFLPSKGEEGTSVTITGSQFAAITKVLFNGTPTSFQVINSTTIQAVVPVGASTGPVAVATDTATGTSSAKFTVVVDSTGTTPGTGTDPDALSKVTPDPQSVASEVDFAQAPTAPDFIATSAPAGYQQYSQLVAAFLALVNGAPTALDTLKEIADQLASNKDGAAGMLASINQLKQWLGDLATLSTVAKTNLVAAINELFTNTQSVTSAVWGYSGGGQTSGFADIATAMVSRRGTTIQLNAAICPMVNIAAGSTIYCREIYGQGRYILTGSDGIVPAYWIVDSVKFIGNRGVLVKYFAGGTPCKITTSQLPTLELEANAVANVHATEAGQIKGAAGSVVNLYSGCTWTVHPDNLATINNYTQGSGSPGGPTYSPGAGIDEVALAAGIIATKVHVGTGTVVKLDGLVEEYPAVTSGTFTVDTTGAKVGIVVGIELGASASQPTLDPMTFDLVGSGTYQAGKRLGYAFRMTASGRVEYMIYLKP